MTCAVLEAPVLVRDVHLDAPLPELDGAGRNLSGRVLVRWHGVPLGEIVVPLGRVPLPREALAEIIRVELAEPLRRHCAADGAPVPDPIPSSGLSSAGACRSTYPRTDTAVTVVVATRDRTPSLMRLIASLSAADHPNFDLVVVDSAPSDDATARAVRSLTTPFPVRYVHTPTPGLAYAHNCALPYVTGDIVAFTDDDVLTDPGWLRGLAGPFADPAVVCVTGLILPAELETRAQVLVEQAGGFDRGFVTRRYSLLDPPADPLFPFTAGRMGSGANMAFRTDWLHAHSGFDPATGAGTPAKGGDDLLALLEVVLSGGCVVYEPAAVIRHFHRRGYDGMRRQAYGYGVGLGAYLAAAISRHPAQLGTMLRRSVPALRHVLVADSPRNDRRSTSFPAELVWRERAGVLVGALAYAVSRYRYRGVQTSCVRRGPAPR